MTEIIRADLENPTHQQAILMLLNAYAADPMGSGHPLDKSVQERLLIGLTAHPTTLIFLARKDRIFTGIATCFLGFSTFKAKSLINIHDIAVLPEYRGKGIGRQLLRRIRKEAEDTGCCKVTLEVREDNHSAEQLYRSEGFQGSNIDGKEVQYLFLEHPISSI